MKKLLRKLIASCWPKIQTIAIVDGFKFNSTKYLFINKYNHGIPSPKQERGVIYGINNFVQQGMKALQIGSGNGLTSLYTLRKIGTEGFLTIYEPGTEQIQKVNSTLKSNNYGNYKVINKYVGNPVNAWSDIGRSQLLSYTEIPNCDYLELDCEGCEKDFLENMIIRPHIIIVEIHNNLLNQDNQWLFSFINDNDYKVLYYSGHDGEIISKETFNELSKKSLEQDRTTVHYLGTRTPVVVGIIKNK